MLRKRLAIKFKEPHNFHTVKNEKTKENKTQHESNMLLDSVTILKKLLIQTSCLSEQPISQQRYTKQILKNLHQTTNKHNHKKLEN